METRQVSCNDIYLIRYIKYILLLLRPASKTIKYYTDSHEVDEDAMAALLQGGDWGIWWPNPMDGVTARDMVDSPTFTFGAVASRLIYLS